MGSFGIKRLSNDETLNLDSYSSGVELELEAIEHEENKLSFMLIATRVRSFEELAGKFNDDDVVVRTINKSTNNDLVYKQATLILSLSEGDGEDDIKVAISYFDIDGVSYEHKLGWINGFMAKAQEVEDAVTKLLKVVIALETEQEPAQDDSVVAHVCIDTACRILLGVDIEDEKEEEDGISD